MKGFTLTGEGIEVRYSADEGVLFVKGQGELPEDGRNFSGDDLVITESELGTILTVDLTGIRRDASQVRLSVLVPSGLWKVDEAPITGAGIILMDKTGGAFGLNRTQAKHVFDVRQLSGTMQDPKAEPTQ